jgi:hypothetical protein
VEKTLLNGMLSSVSKTPENLMCSEIAKQVGNLVGKSTQVVRDELEEILNNSKLSRYGSLIIGTARDMAAADLVDL